MIAGIHISQEIFPIDVLTALKSPFKYRRNQVLRLLQLYGDQVLFSLYVDISVWLLSRINCNPKMLVTLFKL